MEEKDEKIRRESVVKMLGERKLSRIINIVHDKTKERVCSEGELSAVITRKERSPKEDNKLALRFLRKTKKRL